MLFDIANPDPAGTVEALRSLGYSLESAVADLIDNSIDAGAGRVDIRFRWDGEASSVAVLDNGSGMDASALLTAMTPGAGGGHVGRDADELGRFGMGLKTASFSQCQQLVVAGRPPRGEWHVRTWDLDVVVRTGEWRLLDGCPDEARPELLDLMGDRPQGVVVLWRRLQRLVAPGANADDETSQQRFYGEIGRVERHLVERQGGAAPVLDYLRHPASLPGREARVRLPRRRGSAKTAGNASSNGVVGGLPPPQGGQPDPEPGRDRHGRRK